ncbi:DUF354 domain-containing protein [Helicobacter cholecystus]|uniref:DUF354 domain-containing protein n=1 Tax=Helicobacter cholecystus TaxID=45498 RepID=UPI002739FABD|nr:DUF354 domain-containing protein [Helicobacter cholecystus]
MIWLDITDPKYVLFFKGMLPLLKKIDEVIITTRGNEDYSETHRLLELFKIEAYCIGGYGGASKLGKLQARLQRQNGFLSLFERLGKTPQIFITGASVEGVQTAYGLGIPVINFADTPIAGHIFSLQALTILSRLTLPLSSLVFHPFVVPAQCYEALGVAKENIIAYEFIDVALWLRDLKKGKDFREELGLDSSLPCILIREEEYKAHYVKEKLPIIYESVHLLSSSLNANLVIMPRYGSEGLIKEFGGLNNVHILEKKLDPSEFYPYIDLLIGGGGTMNLESCYLGIPTISTRSLFLYHDIYLLENRLMHHAKTPQEVLFFARNILSKLTPPVPNAHLFEKEKAGFEKIVETLKQRFFTPN